MNTTRHSGAARIKNYMRTEYPSFWINKVQEYGFSSYHARLIELITSLTSQRNGPLLEVGIGTGWPFAMTLSEQGYTVYGVDLAELLIREAKVCLGENCCLIGDAESLPYGEGVFTLVYCLQSTWYFPDMARALAEMVRVTQSGGTMVFDIMNLASTRIFWAEVLAKRGKNFMRNIYSWSTRLPLLPFFSHEHPITPWRINQILSSLPLNWRVALPEDPQRHLRAIDYFHYRLVYICRKK